MARRAARGGGEGKRTQGIFKNAVFIRGPTILVHHWRVVVLVLGHRLQLHKILVRVGANVMQCAIVADVLGDHIPLVASIPRPVSLQGVDEPEVLLIGPLGLHCNTLSLLLAPVIFLRGLKARRRRQKEIQS